MTDREKVIKGLECHLHGSCIGCPYDNHVGDPGCIDRGIMTDALALLKAQEPRVMTWEEAQANVNEGPFIIMELRDRTGTEIDYGVLAGDSYEMSEGSLLTVCDFGLLKDEYGKRFRCWTSKPTQEQMEVTPWN